MHKQHSKISKEVVHDFSVNCRLFCLWLLLICCLLRLAPRWWITWLVLVVLTRSLILVVKFSYSLWFVQNISFLCCYNGLVNCTKVAACEFDCAHMYKHQLCLLWVCTIGIDKLQYLIWNCMIIHVVVLGRYSVVYFAVFEALLSATWDAWVPDTSVQHVYLL